MRQRTLCLLVACLILFAGCTGGTGPGNGDGEASTSPTLTSTTAAAPSTATQTTATATPTPEPTPTAEWSSPTPPHRPTETADDQPNRIKSVEFTNKVAAENGDGYTDFDLAVHANTTMKNVDPAEYGTVGGEPYFLVVINGKIIERTKIVLQEDDRQFNITVRQAGLANFDPGKLSVKVLLMDEDSQHDDVFGTWSGEIRYNPD